MMVIEDMIKSNCPNCGSELVIEISFGFPDPDAEYPKSYYNGGCCIDENTPKYHCTSCGNDFRSIFSNENNFHYLFSNEYRTDIGLPPIPTKKALEENKEPHKPCVFSLDKNTVDILINGKLYPWINGKPDIN